MLLSGHSCLTVVLSYPHMSQFRGPSSNFLLRPRLTFLMMMMMMTLLVYDQSQSQRRENARRSLLPSRLCATIYRTMLQMLTV